MAIKCIVNWAWRNCINTESRLKAMPIVRVRMQWHTTQALTATVFSSTHPNVHASNCWQVTPAAPSKERPLRSSSFLGFPSGFKAVSMFFPFWFELKNAGRCRFELKTPTYQSYIDTYMHTYIPTSVLVWNWSETSSEASIVSSGKGRANHTEDCLFDINLLTYSRPLYSGTHGMWIR